MRPSASHLSFTLLMTDLCSFVRAVGVSRGMKEAQTGEDEELWKAGDNGFVVGVDPVGSILATNGEGDISGYQVVSLFICHLLERTRLALTLVSNAFCFGRLGGNRKFKPFAGRCGCEEDRF